MIHLTLVIAMVSLPVAAIADEGGSSSQQQTAARPPGSFKLIGHSPLEDRGMNAALAVKGNYAYVGSRTDGPEENRGVYVVDISNPAQPKVVHEIGPPHEGNEGETSREMRIWPEKNLLIVMNLGSNCSEAIHGCSPRSVDDNFRFYDIRGKRAAKPKFLAEYHPSVNPHEFFLWDDPKRRGRALMFMSTPSGATQLLVTDISRARRGKFKELYKTGFPIQDGDLHSLSISVNGRRGYMAYLQGGFFMIDTSDFARAVRRPKIRIITPMKNRPTWEGPGAHSAVRLFRRQYALVTDEVYGEALRALGHGCPWGWMRMIDLRDARRPKVAAHYGLMPYNDPDFCSTDPPRPSSSYSAHNPTLTPHLAFITWHSGGLQAVSIQDPKHPFQMAEYRPEPLPFVTMEDPALSAGQDKVVMWSFPIIKRGLIYVVDIRNGLYVLKYRGPFQDEVSRVRFLEGNSNLGAARRFAD